MESLARWMLKYLQAWNRDKSPRSTISTALGAAEVLMRVDLKTGAMQEPTQQEKDLAFYLLDQAQKRHYRADETVAALIGVADGLALQIAAQADETVPLSSVPGSFQALAQPATPLQARTPGPLAPSR